MTLRENIAKLLMQSRIGMTRKELFEKTDARLHNDDANRISDQLFHLKKANHAHGLHGARWSITPQGRSYYSDLNDDETDDQTQPTQADPIPSVDPISVDHWAESDRASSEEIQTADNNAALVLDSIQTQESALKTAVDLEKTIKPIQTAEMARTAIEFDTTQILHKALYGLCNLILDVATQEHDTITIQNKADAITLLERMESNDMFSGQHRATFSRIRQAIELMEDAP